MTSDSHWLPPLLVPAVDDKDLDLFMSAVYEVFRRDFVDSKPKYPEKRFALKRYPLRDGKEATFWHLVSSGLVEASRIVIQERCEKICWPKPIIEAKLDTERVNLWRNLRKGEERILIALWDFSYLVVLADRAEYVLLWTAYPVDFEHSRRKLRKEYRAWIAAQKADAAPKDGIVTPSTHGR